MSTPIGSRAPLGSVLVVDTREWPAQALESVLRGAGYVVTWCKSIAQTFSYVHSISPDAVFIGSDMAEFSGAQLCRTLREHPQVGAATPILMTSIAPVRRTDRVEALRAGAWDLIALPADTTELMLRLELFMRAKQEVVTARARSLLDISTDLYSRPGLLRRLRELSLDAYRRHTPVACLIVAPESEVQPRDAPTFDVATVTAQTMTRLMNDTTRASDTVGRLTHTEFAVIAPQTNSDGAIRLAERLYGSAQTLPPVYAESPLRVRIGCYAIESFEATVPPVEILARASTALQRAQYDLSAAPICVYD